VNIFNRFDFYYSRWNRANLYNELQFHFYHNQISLQVFPEWRKVLTQDREEIVLQ
jgi:hypothetical protein